MKNNRPMGSVYACVAILGMALPGTAFCNELQNAGFESDVDDVTLSSSLPSQVGIWSGDQAQIVAVEQGVTPLEGGQMLKFINTDPWYGNGSGDASQQFQIIDVSGLRQQIDAGLVTLSASAIFNRIAGNDKDIFGLHLYAQQGDPANWPADPFTYRTGDSGDILLFSDTDVSTWESVSGTLPLAVGTDFVVVSIFASEYPPPYVTTEFEGHYADAVTATLIIDVQNVQIDVKPGSDPNCFNLNGHGVIPVAILGSADFDVSTINTDSAAANPLSFNGLQVRVRGKKGPLCSTEYLNGDSYLDLVCHFQDDPNEWLIGSEETATLTGELLDGTLIEGADSICITGQ